MLLRPGCRKFIAGTDNLHPFSSVRAIPQDPPSPGLRLRLDLSLSLFQRGAHRLHPSISLHLHPSPVFSPVGLPAPWIEALQSRGSGQKRERERESVPPPPPPPPQFAVCYVSDSEVESQSCSSGESQPLKQNPRCLLSSVPASLLTSPGLFLPGAPGSFCFFLVLPFFFLSTPANSLLFFGICFIKTTRW